jgi:hypothetical protein
VPHLLALIGLTYEMLPVDKMSMRIRDSDARTPILDSSLHELLSPSLRQGLVYPLGLIPVLRRNDAELRIGVGYGGHDAPEFRSKDGQGFERRTKQLTL